MLSYLRILPRGNFTVRKFAEQKFRPSKSLLGENFAVNFPEAELWKITIKTLTDSNLCSCLLAYVYLFADISLFARVYLFAHVCSFICSPCTCSSAHEVAGHALQDMPLLLVRPCLSLSLQLHIGDLWLPRHLQPTNHTTAVAAARLSKIFTFFAGVTAGALSCSFWRAEHAHLEPAHAHGMSVVYTHNKHTHIYMCRHYKRITLTSVCVCVEGEREYIGIDSKHCMDWGVCLLCSKVL